MVLWFRLFQFIRVIIVYMRLHSFSLLSSPLLVSRTLLINPLVSSPPSFPLLHLHLAVVYFPSVLLPFLLDVIIISLRSSISSIFILRLSISACTLAFPSLLHLSLSLCLSFPLCLLILICFLLLRVVNIASIIQSSHISFVSLCLLSLY